MHQEGAVGVAVPRPDEKRCHQEAVVEVVDRPHLFQLVVVGVVEDLHYLTREVVAEEVVDHPHLV